MKNNNKHRASCVFLTTLVLLILTSGIFGQNMFRKISDFDGDGKADFAITRNENGKTVWYLWQSTTGYRVFQWGLDTDLLAPGDYDGDGTTDITVFRRTVGTNATYYTFYIYQSSTASLNTQTFSIQGGDAPASPYPQDFDGDGKTDIAIILTNLFSNTIVIDESQNHALKTFGVPFSLSGYRLGDLTGDGKADFFTSSSQGDVNITNYATRSVRSLHFGAYDDQYLPGDFDGDGTGDLTVFRASDGSWWTLRSSDGTVQVANWGMTWDIPVPADYDGDGKTDFAIYRHSAPQSNYWVYGSQTGVQVIPFGNSDDLPVRY